MSKRLEWYPSTRERDPLVSRKYGTDEPSAPWTRGEILWLAIVVLLIILVALLATSIGLMVHGGNTVYNEFIKLPPIGPMMLKASDIVDWAHQARDPVLTNRIITSANRVETMMQFIVERQMLQKAEQLMRETEVMLRQLQTAMALMGAAGGVKPTGPT